MANAQSGSNAWLQRKKTSTFQKVKNKLETREAPKLNAPCMAMEKTHSLLKSNILNMWQNPTKKGGNLLLRRRKHSLFWNMNLWDLWTRSFEIWKLGENQRYFNFLKKSMKVGKDLWKLPPKLLRNYEHVTTLAKIPSDIWVTSLRQFPVLDWHGVIMCNIPLAGHVSMASNPGH
jgi:hypothetical protein